eukprot:Skav224206  [mRNA]  locus=scaffold939:833115:838716:- [translate_table: standard]
MTTTRKTTICDAPRRCITGKQVEVGHSTSSPRALDQDSPRLSLGHDAVNWLSHAAQSSAGQLMHGKMSVATSALGSGMDSSLAAKLAAVHSSQASNLESGLAVGSCKGAPSAWGPAMWKSLHCMVHNMPKALPPDQQRSFKERRAMC